MHTSTRVLAAAAVAAVLSQPSPAWAQAVGPDLTIAMSHAGNFTWARTGCIRLWCPTSEGRPAGRSAAPITLTVLPSASGTVTNKVQFQYPCNPTVCTDIPIFVTDPTIVLAGVPTLPQWALIALTVLLAFAGFVAMRRRTA